MNLCQQKLGQTFPKLMSNNTKILKNYLQMVDLMVSHYYYFCIIYYFLLLFLVSVYFQCYNS